MKKRVMFIALIGGIIAYVYRFWFLHAEIIGGDWPYYYKDFLPSFSLYPIIWQPWLNNGLGGAQPLLGLSLFGSSLVVPFVNWLHIPWTIVYQVGWYGLFIAVSVYGSKKLWEAVTQDSRERFPWWALTALVFTANTYILMVTGGGQMGVALAYAVAPLVLASFIQISNFKRVIWAGSLFAFQLMIDPRIAYVTMVGVGIFQIANSKWQIANVISTFVVPLVIAAGVNAFWIVPMVVMRSNPLEGLGAAFTSVESLKFFSFADFSHALSLLHPNWPENIFGKTYFLQPEFLVLPLLAFSSLLCWKKFKNIFFFVILGLIGVFFAKGANEPFGGVYVWLFEHVPGFVMFRDPTKWYVLIAISYSILIPFTLARFGKTVLMAVFILFWLFTIRQSVFGNLGGTFAKHTVPQEYRELEGFLQKQPNFARTLWVPRQQRFSYGTLDHMPVEAEPLFGATTAAQLKVKLNDASSMELLNDLGIGYVMIPYDSLGELFLSDRRYDEKKRQEYETVLDGVGWLTKIQSGNLTIYQTPRHRDLFWVSNDEPLTYRQIRPDRYAVSFTVGEPATVYFSQAYHRGWVLRNQNTSIQSRQSPQGLNSFLIPAPGTYEGVVEFEPQKYVSWGMAISLLTVLGAVLAFML